MMGRTKLMLDENGNDVIMWFIRALQRLPDAWRAEGVSAGRAEAALRVLQAKLRTRGHHLSLPQLRAKIELVRRLYVDHRKFHLLTGHRSLHVAEKYFTNLQFLGMVDHIQSYQLDFGYNHQKTLEDMHGLFDSPAINNPANVVEPTLSFIFPEHSADLVKTITDTDVATRMMISNNGKSKDFPSAQVVILNPKPTENPAEAMQDDSTDYLNAKKNDVIDLDSDESNDLSEGPSTFRLEGRSIAGTEKRKTEPEMTPNRQKLLNLVSEIISEDQSDYGPFGLYIVRKLREMTPEMAIYCRKLISDAIHEAESGRLNNNSTIVDIL